MIVADGAAGLRHVGNAAAVGALDVVAKGEEGVAAKRHAAHTGEIFLLFLRRQRLGAHGEEVLPDLVAQHVAAFLIGEVEVDGVVALGAGKGGTELQSQHLGMMPQLPEVGLVAGQTGAVYARLLPRAHADGLPAHHVADGVGLRVLEGDEGDEQVALRLRGQGFVFGDDVFKQTLVQLQRVAPLLEGNAKAHLALQRRRHVIFVDLDDVVIALALAAKDLQRFRLVAGGDDAVGHFPGNEFGRGYVADVAQRDKIAVGGKTVGAAGARVGAGEGGKLRPRGR